MAVSRRDCLRGMVIAGSGTALAMTNGPTAVAKVRTPGSSRIDYRPTLLALKRYMELHLREYGLPGIALCVADEDGFTATLSAGWANVDRREPMTPSHRLPIGSISKSITALAIFRLVQAGEVDLDTEASSLLPGLPLPRDVSFSVAQLLDHSTGLPSNAPIFPRGGDERLWLGYVPGSKMTYSNTGYALLGRILERIEGRPYGEIIQSLVLQPLGMADARPILAVQDQQSYATGYRPYLTDRPYPRRGQLGAAPWVDFAEAAGSVGASAATMTHYVRYLIQVGRGRGGPLFSDALAERYRTPTIDAPVFGPQARYGNGVVVVPIDGRPFLHHTGGMSAFCSSIHVDAAAGVGSFAGVNAMIGSYRPRAVTAYACMLMRAAREGRELPPPPPVVAAEVVDNAATFAGRYVSSNADAIELRPKGDGLGLIFDGGEATLQRAEADQFLVLHPKFSLHPLDVEKEDGAIVRVWWGSTPYALSPDQLPAPSPAGLHALAGRYDSDSPWIPTFRILARGDQLWADRRGPLTLQPDGSYRLAGSTTERIRFDAMFDGRAQRMNLSGMDFLRRPDSN